MFERLTLRMFVFNTCDGECYFVGFGVLGKEDEELLDRDERELRIWVAGIMISLEIGMVGVGRELYL